MQLYRKLEPGTATAGRRGDIAWSGGWLRPITPDKVIEQAIIDGKVVRESDYVELKRGMWEKVNKSESACAAKDEEIKRLRAALQCIARDPIAASDIARSALAPPEQRMMDGKLHDNDCPYLWFEQGTCTCRALTPPKP